MKETTRYTFRIEGFTPETMPLKRLLAYYSEIAKMLEVDDHLHLTGVLEGSHRSTLVVDPNHESELRKRIAEIKEGTAPKAAIKAHDTINEMLCEDETSGGVFDESERNVIPFPGRRPEREAIYRIRDAATFTGKLYHIAETNEGVNVRVRTEAYGVVACKTTLDIGKELRGHLFGTVKVRGHGIWTRTGDGKWSIDDFSLIDFAPVSMADLRETVDRLRALDIEWPDDPIQAIRNIEEKDGQFR